MANPRDVDLDIVGHDHTGRATRSAGNNLDQLRRKVDDVSSSNNSLEKTAKRATSRMGTNFVETAAKIRAAGPYAAVAAIAAGIVALPTIAAAAGIGMVAGLGGGLLAIGIKAATMNQKVRSAFTQTKNHVVSRLREMARPFEPVLIKIAKRASSTFDSFAPALSDAFKRMAPALDRFSIRFFAAFKKLKPAIRPLTDSFVRLLDQIGPKLPGFFKAVSDAVIDVTNALKSNPEAVGRVIGSFESMVKWTGKIIAWLIRANSMVAYSVSAWQNGVASIKVAWASVGTKVQTVVADIAESMASLPGPLGAPFREMARTARAKANESQRALDSLKTEQARAQVEMLQARIKFLKGKKVVTDVDRGRIAAARAEIATLQGKINGVRGKTVTVTVNTRATGGAVDYLRGTIKGYSAGASWGPMISGGGSYRTGGPQPISVTAGPTNVDARVFLDGKTIAATARSIVTDQTSRNAYRARYGRRY